MMIEIEATYENGVLKPHTPLPLTEHQRVTVVVRDQPGAARRAFGVIGWQGEPEVVRKVAMDSDLGVSESP